MKHLFEFNFFQTETHISIKEPTVQELKEFQNTAEVAGEAEYSLLHFVISKKCKYLGVYVDDKLATVACYIPNIEETKIELLITDGQYRNQKIGARLVQHIIDQDKTGIIVANPFTNESEEFFAKLGFVMEEEYDDNDPNTMVFRKFT